MSGEFINVAAVSSLPPGQGRTVHVRGLELALFNIDGTFYAIEDRCPHRGGPLGGGWCENGQVFCPLHGWAFDVKTGACLSNSAKPVATYPTRIEGEEVQVCLTPSRLEVAVDPEEES